MAHYKMSDVAVEVNDRENNPANSQYERFVGLEHYVSGEVIIRNYGNTQNLESTMKVFQSGDVLVARRNVYLKRAATVDFDGLTSGDSIVLRAKNPIIGRILPFVLNTDEFWDFADQYSDGTMSKRLSPKTLMTYEFDLPNEDELEFFADLLWAANDARESYQELLRQTDELVKSQFVEMFGNPVDNSRGLPVKPMTELCEIIDGDRGKNYPKDFSNEGYCLFLNAKNVTEAGFVFEEKMYISKERDELLRKGKLKRGDIVLTTRGTIGNIAYYSDDIPYENVRINSGMVIIRLDHTQIQDEFYIRQLRLLVADIKRTLVSGSAQPQLPIKVMNNIQMIVPPIEEQKRYIEFAEQSDKSKFEIKKAIENTSALIKSLMQQDLSN